MSEQALECYRQRYETWRHLDSKRYVTVQITVASFAGLAAIADTVEENMPIWGWLAYGIFLFFQAKLLSKINDGVVANGKALEEYGKAVGDVQIPCTHERKSSVFYYLEWIIFFASIMCILKGGIDLIGVYAN